MKIPEKRITGYYNRAEGLSCVLAWFQTRGLLSAKSSILYLAIVNKGFVNEKYVETCPMSTATESESSRYLTAAAQATWDKRPQRRWGRDDSDAPWRRSRPAAPSPAVGHAHSFFLSKARLNHSHPLQAILRAKHNLVHTLSLQVQEYVAFLRIA